MKLTAPTDYQQLEFLKAFNADKDNFTVDWINEALHCRATVQGVLNYIATMSPAHAAKLNGQLSLDNYDAIMLCNSEVQA